MRVHSVSLLAALLAASVACSETVRRTVGGGGGVRDSGAGTADAEEGADGSVFGDAAEGSDASPLADSGDGEMDAGGGMDAEPGLELPGTDAAPPLDGGPGADAAPGDATAPDAMAIGMDAAGPADSGPRDAGGMPLTCDPTFGAGQACGGTLAGTWTYVGGCVDPAAILARVQLLCPSATISNQAHSSGGTLTVDANGTITRNVSNTTTGDVHVPSACASIVGGCSGVEFAITSQFPSSTATCVAAGADCDCAVATITTLNDTGTYTVNGGVVTVHSGGNTLEYYYCVSGNTLHYHGLATNAFDDEVTYVLTK